MSVLIKGMEMPKHAAVNGEKDTAYKCVILAHPNNSVELVIDTKFASAYDNGHNIQRYLIVENIEEICKDFKDRPRFVELPCKAGQKIFRIKNGKIQEGVATAFFYGKEFHIVNCKFSKTDTGIPFHRFGKTVFLTREEAEAALKERENNA